MLKVKKVNYDKDYTCGCKTCDYGSEYITDIEIEFEDYGTIIIETSQMYEYTLTECDYMKLLGNSEDLDDFYKNMFNLIKEKSYDIEDRVKMEYMQMKINGNSINIIESCKLGKIVKNIDKE